MIMLLLIYALATAIGMTSTLFWVVWWGSFIVSVIDLFLDAMERVQRIRQKMEKEE